MHSTERAERVYPVTALVNPGAGAVKLIRERDFYERGERMDNIKACYEKIFNQTQGKSGIVKACGSMLFDIVRESADLAEIVLKSLDNSEKSVTRCERAIRANANELHRIKKTDYVKISAEEAKLIIRKFYGLPLQTAETEI